MRGIRKGVLLIAALVCIGLFINRELKNFNYEAKVLEEIVLVDEMEGIEISYTIWEAAKMQTCYVVLPSMYAAKKIDFQIQYNQNFYKLYIDDKMYQSGEMWEGLTGEMVYRLRAEDIFGRILLEKPLQILISENLPVMMVTVDSKDALYEIKEYSNKQYAEKGNIVMFDGKGNPVVDEQLKKIAVRGNTSAKLSKKPFRIEFMEPVSLCGMAPATQWNLIANAKDGTHIRNKMILDWAKELGEDYNVSCDYVELFINGQYQGIYLLTETVTVGENRLELDTQNSVLAEMELYYRVEESAHYFSTRQQHYWVLHSENYLKEEEIVKIKEHFDEIESALYAKDGKGEKTGKDLQELLDFDSWTDAWLLEEISSDVDLGTTSQFAYIKDWNSRSPLMAGPEWDFDSTLGNSSLEAFREPRNLVAAIWNTKGIQCITQNKWLAPMYENEAFKTALIEKYEQEIRPKIQTLLEEEIDNYILKIRRAVLLDALRWRGNGITDYTYQPKEFEAAKTGDYHRYDIIDKQVDYLKEFLREKEKFLTELWLEGVEFEVIIEERNFDGMNLELNNDIYTWIRKEDMEDKK